MSKLYRLCLLPHPSTNSVGSVNHFTYETEDEALEAIGKRCRDEYAETGAVSVLYEVTNDYDPSRKVPGHDALIPCKVIKSWIWSPVNDLFLTTFVGF